MQHLDIHKKRIRQFQQRVHEKRYGSRSRLSVSYTYDSKKPIPLDSLSTRSWKPISAGASWGNLWGSAWFRLQGRVPAEFAGQEVVALIDIGSEGCVFVDGVPFAGLTDAPRTPGDPTGKRRIPLITTAKGGEAVDLLVEAGANQLVGFVGKHEFALHQAELAVMEPEFWQLGLDLEFLVKLAEALPQESTRARKLWTKLNDAANAWCDGAGHKVCKAICAELLKPRANASAPTAWSIGHAHLDLGWLWPVRETRRKAGRTFSTALKLMEEYPDYYFGASQPQAYQWVKEDYPELYRRMEKQIAAGRWECQGAMWVEPDLNVPSGESLVRQLLYGKRFFREEFGIDVDNLWLPDVFGYTAALPQILKKAGVNYFMTQKISWNETNEFPHHSFVWEGIDGSRVLTHFLPMNDYVSQNNPGHLVFGEQHFAQADVLDDFLNLYGVGDGGGGPSRHHIEFARRAANTEGLPRVKMAPATEFFYRLGRADISKLPLWRGELYLELHRGTYTTQARLKRYNRRLEHALHDAEFFSVLSGLDQRADLAEIWRDTLLNQFHDILPGSSITEVYDDAHRISKANLARVAQLIDASLTTLHGPVPRRPTRFLAYNTLAWERHALVELPWADCRSVAATERGDTLPVQAVAGGVLVPVIMPSAGCTTIDRGTQTAVSAPARHRLAAAGNASEPPSTGRWSLPSIAPVHATKGLLENRILRVTFGNDGTIASIYDKQQDREVLRGSANQLRLWEDYPYGWDAWEISHYYRETAPEQACLLDRSVEESGPLRAVVAQTVTVGNSSIRQRIVLEAESRLVRIENVADWAEQKKMLRVQAEPAILADEATYEIQYGTVKRPTHGNTSWDQARFEVPGQRFVDISQSDYGFALLNDCKYGHHVRDGFVDLTLLRSPKHPDPMADQGQHRFIYGYYPHPSRWELSDVLEQAHELNAPPLLRGVGARQSIEVPGGQFGIDGGVVKLEAIKPSEDGPGVILRLYETRGTSHHAVLWSRQRWSTIREVNLLEEDPRGAKGRRRKSGDGRESSVELEFGPYEIRTFRIEFSE